MVPELGLVVAAVAAVRGLWSPCGLSMVSSLNPVAERARGNRWSLTAGWYVLGAIAGGAALGGGCALLALAVGAGTPDARVTGTIAATAALICLVSDTGLTRWRLPLLPRQVNERWLARYRRWIYAAGFGVQIGTGFATYVMTAAVYLTAVLAALTASPLQALAIGTAFGAVRGLAILLAAGATTPDRLRALHCRLDALAGPAFALCVAVEGLVVLGAATAAGGVAGAAIAAAVVVAVLLLTAVRRPAAATGAMGA